MQSNQKLSSYKHPAAFALWLILLAAGFVWAAAAAAQEPDESVPLDTDADQCGISVYDWNRQVTASQKGFPRNNPPEANGDWTQPINYAEGTLYFRVEIFSQPQPQDMKLQYCVWQDNNALENCANKKNVNGTPGTVVTWSDQITEMYKKGGQPIDWSRPRYKDGVAIKNSDGKPVSSLSGWNWNGEDPDKWYPIKWRFSVRVLPKGVGFSGWAECLNAPTAVSLSGMDTQSPSGGAAAPIILMLIATLGVISLAAARRTGLFKRQV